MRGIDGLLPRGGGLLRTGPIGRADRHDDLARHLVGQLARGAADLDALADKFTIVAQPVGAAGWTLVLTPRDANLAKFLVRATLTGERDVQSVRIEEARGDATQIRFSHQVPAAALSNGEAARFQ